MAPIGASSPNRGQRVGCDTPGGTWTLGDLTVTRFGYGAMQLAGAWVVRLGDAGGPQPGPVAETQTIAPVVCVQNRYNLAYRQDDALIDALAGQGIAYVPYFRGAHRTSC